MGTDAERKETWLYLGERETLTKKPGNLWVSIPLDRNDGSALEDGHDYPAMTFTGRNIAPGKPGTIWEVTCKSNEQGGTTVTTGGPDKPRLLTRWKHTPDVVRWQAQHEAVIKARQEARYLAKEINRNEVRTQLAPLQEAYRRGSRTYRHHLLALVLQELTR